MHPHLVLRASNWYVDSTILLGQYQSHHHHQYQAYQHLEPLSQYKMDVCHWQQNQIICPNVSWAFLVYGLRFYWVVPCKVDAGFSQTVTLYFLLYFIIGLESSEWHQKKKNHLIPTYSFLTPKIRG